MKHLLALITIVGLSSCAQTGDPSSGGLFGYSPSMNQQIMNNKTDQLHATQADTDYQRSRAANLRNQINNQR